MNAGVLDMMLLLASFGLLYAVKASSDDLSFTMF
jgi:hypothetical protein